MYIFALIYYNSQYDITAVHNTGFSKNEGSSNWCIASY